MKLLLDSQAFLWFVWDDPRLSKPAAALIENSSNDVFLSMASAWEIAVKVSIGKLALAEPFDRFIPSQLARTDIRIMSIDLDHVAHVAKLPFHHKDPFDRLIIAQSLVESIPVVSSDGVFDKYGVSRLW